MATIKITGDQVEIDNIATESTLSALAEKMGAVNVASTNISDNLQRTAESADKSSGIFGILSSTAAGTVKSIGGFGASVYDGTARISTATGLLAKNFGQIGKIGMGPVDAIVQAGEGYVNTFRSMSESGAAFGGNILELKNSAANTRMTLDAFANVVTSNSQGFAALGGNVSAGARSFTRFSEAFFESSEGYADQLMMMGMSTEGINEMLAKQMTINRRANLTDERQRNLLLQSTMSLAGEMDAMAKLTGKQKDQIQAEIDASMRKGQVEAKFRLIEMEQGKEAAMAARQQYQQAMMTASMAGPDAIAAVEETFALGQVKSEAARKGIVALGPAADKVQGAFRAIADAPLSNNIDTMVNNMGGAIVERINSKEFLQTAVLADANQFGQAAATMLESGGDLQTAVQRYRDAGKTFSEALELAKEDAKKEAKGQGAGAEITRTINSAELAIGQLGSDINDKLLGPEGPIAQLGEGFRALADQMGPAGRMKMSGSVDELTNTLSKSMGLTSGASDANDAQKQSIQNVAKSIQNMYDDANTTEEQKRELAELTGVIATLKTQIPQVGEIIEAEILVAGGLKKYIDDQFVGGEDLMRKLQNQPDIDVGDLPDAIKDMKFVADAVTSGKAPGNVGNTDLSARDIIANTFRVDNFDITPFEKGSAEVLGGQGVLPSNMMAMLHKGERVLNASETNAYNALESKANTFAEQASAFQGGMSNSGGTVAEKLDNLNQTMLQLVNINMQVNDTARRQLKGIKGMSGNVMTGFNV
jgi:hypothetical protein